MKIKDLHDIYGPVVRIAPNELSFISPKAWNDIYSDKTFALERGAIFYGVMGQNTSGHDDHASLPKCRRAEEIDRGGADCCAS